MPKFRYRTAALTGPWRDSADLAVRDAVKAKQAEADGTGPGGIRWLVPGQIEEEQIEGRYRSNVA